MTLYHGSNAYSGRRAVSDIQKQMIELSAMDLVSSVAASRKVSPSEAMAVVYKSPFFLKLQDPETGLYRESKDYLLALFNRETGVKAEPRGRRRR